MNNNMIVCKACGEEIAKSAKACPKCGAKNKKPIYKRPGIIILLVILLVILFFVLKSVIDNASSTVTIYGNSGTTETTISGLVDELEDNEAYFSENYIGKKAEICGKITETKSGYYYTNLLHDFDGVIVINGSIYVEVGDDVSQYRAGDKVKVVGELSDSLFTDIYMYGPNKVTVE